jgi:hypothetical protein
MSETHVEATILQLAGRQQGLVTRGQILALGLGPDAIGHRVRARRLQPVQKGVYRVGPLLGAAAREMAAVLACGRDAFVGDGSAAALWSLLPKEDPSRPVSVIVRSPHRRRRPGVRVRCAPGLRDDEVTVLDGVPLTTPARTLLDLAGSKRPALLEQAVARGEREGMVDRAGLVEMLRRQPSSAGAGALRALTDALTDPKLSRSDAEDRFLALVSSVGLPEPEMNATVGRDEVDFVWRSERVVVEVDGFRFHRSRGSFVNDRRKGARLSGRGFQVIRVTWDDLVHEPTVTLVQLALALGAGAAR